MLPLEGSVGPEAESSQCEDANHDGRHCDGQAGYPSSPAAAATAAAATAAEAAISEGVLISTAVAGKGDQRGWQEAEGRTREGHADRSARGGITSPCPAVVGHIPP